MSETLRDILTTTLPPAISAAVAWIFARRKNNASANASELENVEKALVIYRGIITDLHNKIKELEVKLGEMEKIIKDYNQKKQ